MKKILTLSIFLVGFLFNNSICQSSTEIVSKLQKALDAVNNDQTDSLHLKFKGTNLMHMTAEDREAAQPYLKQMEEVLKKKNRPAALADVYMVYHYVKFSAGELDEAIRYTEKALELMKKLPHPDTIRMAYMEDESGEVYFRKGDFGKASQCFERGIRLLEQCKKTDNKVMYDLYYFTGVIAAEQGHFQKALGAMSQAQALGLKVFGEGDPRTALDIMSFGNIYALKGEYDKALQYHQEGLDKFLEVADSDNPDIIYFWPNLAWDYARLGNHEKAQSYFEKALEVEIDINGPDHPSQVLTISNLGKSCFDQGKLDQAEEYYNKSLDLFFVMRDTSNAYIAEVYNNFGRLYLKRKNWDQAIYYFNKAIASNLVEIANDTLAKSIPEAYFHHPYFIRTLLLKNEALLSRYEKNGNPQDLQEALSNIERGDALIGKLRQSHISQGDLIIFNQIANNFYNKAIDACYLSNQNNQVQQILEKAFQYAEKNKSMALLNAVKSMQALQYAGIADTLLERENYLKKELSAMERQIIGFQQKGNSDAINNDYLSLKNEHAELIAHIEKQYPKYYELKYNSGVVDVPEAQRYLQKNNAALIEYSMNENDLIVFLITPDHFKFWKNPVRNLENEIVNFRNNHFSEKTLNGSSPFSFATDANVLYKMLLADPIASLEKNTQNLIIVPDGALAYLPFDVLVEKKVEEENANFSSLPYLMNRFNCSYAWSTTLLLNQASIPGHKYSKNYIGFAPEYDDESDTLLDSIEFAQATSMATRSGWNDLPAARKGVQLISEFLKGNAFISEKANKPNFFSNISDARIVHLAMHGFLDDSDPLYSGFAFGNSKSVTDQLFAWELYNAEINAELAVLSACQTGVGELKKGEGLMSLSRAFTYAGCPSVIMSLWNIPDEASADIIVDFHKILNNGMPKGVALKKAKLNYLNNSQLPPERLHPFFWAGFIHAGDPMPINFEKTFFNGKWGIGLLLLILVFGLIWMRKR